jgi:hypothetical protein
MEKKKYKNKNNFPNYSRMGMQESLTEGEGSSTVDLLVQTSLDQLLFILQTLFALLQNKLP